MDEQRQKLVESLSGQLQKFEEIHKSVITLKQIPLDVERYVRWKQHTRQLISDHLGEDEARNFHFIDHLGDDRDNVGYSPARLDISLPRYKVYFTVITEGIMDGSIEMTSNQIVNQRYRVLAKIYELSGGNTSKIVSIPALEQETQIFHREMSGILDYLSQKSLIEFWGGDVAYITSKGIDQIERTRAHPERATEHFPANVTYNINIQGDNRGPIQQGGQGNVQNIALTNTNNPDFDRALASIVELIRASSIPDEDKQELEEEAVRVNKLALREPAPGLLERAKSRLEMIRLGLTGTDIAIKAAPHLDTLWELIKQRFGG